ncbi:hypothetical protein PR202_ga27505 [Eleusine coracana subsp. coracana]|uniref:F-box domain-containing protein n=1 Tax=Eleusine coracana subsp. coracana TaxID=191504 RepID=A0AAV5DHB9_ELECO|nr:hypothetical protein PR202_ga27505 [Eleusine coracana subsp. coracana]
MVGVEALAFSFAGLGWVMVAGFVVWVGRIGWAVVWDELDENMGMVHKVDDGGCLGSALWANSSISCAVVIEVGVLLPGSRVLDSSHVRAGSPFDEMPPKDAAAQGASGGIGCRLNVLPDPILLRVLCHLKAWEAVRTCLLSKRWRSLWASALRLDLRQPCGCRGGGGEFDNHRRAEQFAAFVKHLLFRRRPLLRLDALRLCWSHSAYEGDSDTWITHAVRHGAKKIELSGAHHAGYPLPDYLSFVPGDTSDEMRLKIVKLIRVRLDGTTLTQLCSRCSSLEELELIDCLIEGKEIQSTSLRSLNLISCKFVDDFRLDSSNLVSLRCIRPFGYVPRTQYMKHLVTVTIVLDDLCLRNDRQWPPKEEKKGRIS